MKNIDVLKAFIFNGDNIWAKTKNLKIKDGKLINYNTVIAEYKTASHIIVNTTKYSKTTTTIQNKLLSLLKDSPCRRTFETVDNVPKNAESLI